ncbi:hypothetical protein FRC03_000838 [Tulasnella sp. 419]|nr:hypothetical protein FRC03_000838 [Tulasnella sp. 419]
MKNVGLLLCEFCREYGEDFDYERVGISVRDGGSYFQKVDRGWVNQHQQHLLSIEDPLNPYVRREDDSHRNQRPKYGGTISHATHQPESLPGILPAQNGQNHRSATDRSSCSQQSYHQDLWQQGNGQTFVWGLSGASLVRPQPPSSSSAPGPVNGPSSTIGKRQSSQEIEVARSEHPTKRRKRSSEIERGTEIARNGKDEIGSSVPEEVLRSMDGREESTSAKVAPESGREEDEVEQILTPDSDAEDSWSQPSQGGEHPQLKVTNGKQVTREENEVDEALLVPEKEDVDGPRLQATVTPAGFDTVQTGACLQREKERGFLGAGCNR